MVTSLKIAVVSTLLIFGGCSTTDKEDPKSEQKNSDQISKITPATTPRPQSVRIEDDNLHAVYQQYLKLSQALTDGDVSAARLASNALEAGARIVPGGNGLATAAANVTMASSIEKQRSSFSIISNEMVALVKNSGLRSGQIYVDYCPMALNDKGAYWLSSQEDIKNPYFGDAMLTCGEIKDTIK